VPSTRGCGEAAGPRRALEPDRRARILARTRRILNENFPVIAAWLDEHGELFTYTPPDAGAIVYVRYHHPINSSDLVNRLREQKSVLIVPGDHFGMDGYLRLGFGEEPAYLREGLRRLHELLDEVQLKPDATDQSVRLKPDATDQAVDGTTNVRGVRL
jgi:aspartate/methionine/tyrosine aminotransferase